MAEQERWLTATDVAHKLGLSVEPVRRLILAKKLKATKIGRSWRIKESDFQQYLKELEQTQT